MSHIKLLKFQEEGVKFLLSRNRAVLGDCVGLGKTIQMGAALRYFTKRQNMKALVFSPKNAIHQWKDELINKLDFSEKDICVVRGSQESRKAYLEDSSFQVYILTYKASVS